MAKIDKILGSISPLYGMASGEGLFSNIRKISPFMHAIGEGSTNAEKRRRAAQGDKKAAAELVAEGKTPSMKHGGAVKKMAKGGKLTDLTGDGKVTRADVLKGRGVPGFSKGGTASKRADGCATKGKTKGRFV